MPHWAPRWALVFLVQLVWLLMLCLISESCTYFDKTQWCLICVMFWLISISADIRKD